MADPPVPIEQQEWEDFLARDREALERIVSKNLRKGHGYNLKSMSKQQLRELLDQVVPGNTLFVTTRHHVEYRINRPHDETDRTRVETVRVMPPGVKAVPGVVEGCDDIPPGSFHGDAAPVQSPHEPVDSSQQNRISQFSTHCALDIGDRYEILGQIGRGGWGVVYQARDRRSNRIVAIKEICPQPHQLSQAQRRKLQTIEDILDADDHSLTACANIVPCARDWDRNGTPYLVMPFYHTFLSDILQDKGRRVKLGDGIGVEQLHNYIRDLARGLAEGHVELQRVHNDLKPDNIAVSNYGRLLINDWGCSTQFDDAGEPMNTGSNRGSNLLRAPECYQHGYRSRPSSDVWSFGALIYRMITGKYPLEEQLHKKIADLPSLPAITQAYLTDMDISEGKSILRSLWHRTMSLSRKCVKVPDAVKNLSLEEALQRGDEYARCLTAFILSSSVYNNVPSQYQGLVWHCLTPNLDMRIVDGNDLLDEVNKFFTAQAIQAHTYKGREHDWKMWKVGALSLTLVLGSLVVGKRFYEPKDVESAHITGFTAKTEPPAGLPQSAYTDEQLLASTDRNHGQALIVKRYFQAAQTEQVPLINEYQRRIALISKHGKDVAFGTDIPAQSPEDPLEIVGHAVRYALNAPQRHLEDALVRARLGPRVLEQAQEAANSKEWPDYLTAKKEGTFIIPEVEQRFLRTWSAYVGVQHGR